MPMKSNPQGPTGDRVVENIREFRRLRGLSKAEMSRRLAERGRPMTLHVLSKIEAGQRAVDVDDLVAFAAVLDTTPNRLLLDGSAGESALDLTPVDAVPAAEAWRWALGEQPLGFDNDHDGRQRKQRFRAESRPTQAPEATVAQAGPFWDELAAASQLVAAIVRKSGMPADAVLGVVDYMTAKRLEAPDQGDAVDA